MQLGDECGRAFLHVNVVDNSSQLKSNYRPRWCQRCLEVASTSSHRQGMKSMQELTKGQAMKEYRQRQETQHQSLHHFDDSGQKNSANRRLLIIVGIGITYFNKECTILNCIQIPCQLRPLVMTKFYHLSPEIRQFRWCLASFICSKSKTRPSGSLLSYCASWPFLRTCVLQTFSPGYHLMPAIRYGCASVSSFPLTCSSGS